MTEPNASKLEQQNQDQGRPKPVKLDPLGNSTIDIPDGAVHGGEIAKPGQMDGDEDVSASPTDAELKKVENRAGPVEG